MTNNDYIRRAVELADGWRFNEFKGMENTVHAPFFMPFDIMQSVPQEACDALAAQLVRQVDALDNFWVDSDPWGTARVWSGSAFGDGDLARIEKSNDEDRTMNTIKAIIDSKVLNTGEQSDANS